MGVAPGEPPPAPGTQDHEAPQDQEDHEEQASVTRRLLYFLNGRLAPRCRLRGVLPAPGAVRVAVRVGKRKDAVDFLYEIPHGAVSTYALPGLLRAVLTGRRLHSSSDVGEVMGMTLIRLHPERIVADPEPAAGRALTAVRALAEPAADAEDPFLVGFLMRDDGLLRLYVRPTDGPGVLGADVPLAESPSTALLAALPSLVEEPGRLRPSPDDPHCDLLADLTDRF
ncbi:hypothetical protein ACIQPQ_12405 [Streptomyces sp. NPDC091281]|uniref:hypothetical protein n=1 Tax=Streptomyces sp. NPDC091281 TaxID=3365985 RepID=UPI0037F519C2